MCARDLSFWRQKAAEYSLSAAKQCSAVKYNSFWPYGHTPITLNPQNLRRVAGPYILYPVPHGMDGPCPGLRPGDPLCGHPCPHALLQP